MPHSSKPFILVILDGWGISKEREGNAILQANTPVMDLMIKKYPNTLLSASGRDVGLPANQAGNSEAGHVNIGAGRIVEQDEIRVSQSINDGSFFRNPALVNTIKHVVKNKSNIHLMGLLTSDQSAHADPDHLLALITFVNLSLAHINSDCKVYLHLFTDGRDSYQYLAIKLLEKFKKALTKRNHIATISGRFFAMDRIKEWERTELAYNALVLGEGFRADSATEAILQAYNREENDEYIKPTVINVDNGDGRISDNDSIIFFNIRSDRVRQLTKAFVNEEFVGFARKKILKNLCFISMINYGPDLPEVDVMFPSSPLENTLPFLMSDKRQLYVAESEKYAHVTYFFNGGYDHPVANEERVIIKSPPAYTYKTQPEMSAVQLTDIVVQALDKKSKDFIVINYANPDMMAHTGDLKACIEAAEIVDSCLGHLMQAALKHDCTMIVTSDHGNIEEVRDLETSQVLTSHSHNLVPFIVINNNISKKVKMNKGVLGDIAPTILYMLDMPKPKELRENILCKYRIDQQS